VADKFSNKDLIKKIEAKVKEAMVKEGVVDLKAFRVLKNRANLKTILLIEDDETMRTALKRIFEHEGYNVKSAADGTQLASVLDDSPVDLIMLDIGLPWINGFELAHLLKEHPDLKQIPLVFLSGRTSDEDIKRGFDAGADDYIKKPFDIEQIKKTVSVLLQLNKG
jgi:two-component system, OmpR family, aerobic respiration control protein ArcA